MLENKALIDKVLGVLGDSCVCFDDVKMIFERLYGFGVLITDDECFSIAFAILKVERHIKNACNVDFIPKGLILCFVERVCGEFLFCQKQAGNLIDIEPIAKQIQTGDTSVTFAVGEGYMSEEQRVDLLIGYLIGCGEEDFLCYRKMVW